MKLRLHEEEQNYDVTSMAAPLSNLDAEPAIVGFARGFLSVAADGCPPN